MKPSVFALLGAALAITCGQAAAAAETGSPAPDCSLNALGDSQRYDTQRFQDKVLYVDFWASWCGPCAKAFPFLNRLHEELNERGLQVIGVNLDEKPDDAERFLARYPAGFPIVSDPAGRARRVSTSRRCPLLT